MDIDTLLLAVFATWRAANFLANEDGPGGLGGWLRQRLGVDAEGNPRNILGEAVICTWCNSVWVGLGVLVLWHLAPGWFIWLCGPLALSGAAILIGKWING